MQNCRDFMEKTPFPLNADFNCIELSNKTSRPLKNFKFKSIQLNCYSAIKPVDVIKFDLCASGEDASADISTIIFNGVGWLLANICVWIHQIKSKFAQWKAKSMQIDGPEVEPADAGEAAMTWHGFIFAPFNGSWMAITCRQAKQTLGQNPM